MGYVVMADVNLTKGFLTANPYYKKTGVIASIARFLHKCIKHKALFNLGYGITPYDPRDNIIGIALDENTILVNGHINLGNTVKNVNGHVYFTGD